MSRLLSNDEVKTLLSGNDEEHAASASEPVPFDLGSPLLLAGERLARVREMGAQLAPEIGQALARLLRADQPPGVEFSGLQQQRFAALVEALPEHATHAALRRGETTPSAALCIAPELGLWVADALLGGPGKTIDPRPLTRVEMRVLGRLGRAVAAVLSGRLPGSGDGDLDAMCPSAWPDRRFRQEGETLAGLTFRVETPGGNCSMVLILAAEEAYRIAAPPPDSDVDVAGGASILPLALRMKVRVRPMIRGDAMALADLLALKPGDVVRLDVMETEPIGLTVNGHALMAGFLRQQGGRTSFEVTGQAAAPSPQPDEEVSP